MDKARVEDGRVILPRSLAPELDLHPDPEPEHGLTWQQQLDRATEIQRDGQWRLQANPVFRVVFIVGTFVVIVLLDLWLISAASARGGVDGFTIVGVAMPWIALVLSTIYWVRQRRA
jgi:hypothetical protein